MRPSIRSRSGGFRPGGLRNLSIPALAAALGLCLWSCSAEDEKRKALESGALNPPWDSPSFTPRELDGLEPDPSDSLFFVFKVIAMIDSLSGDRKTWTMEDNPADTITIAQLMDTGFVFPQGPVASIPYAYDDSFRDDTLYRNFYGNGLFTQDHPCAQTWLLTGPFLHPARWLKSGLRPAEITQALGTPAFRHRGVLRYFTRRPAPAPEAVAAADAGDAADAENAGSAGTGASEYESFDVMEGVNFYFRKDSLFAAVLHRSQPCH